MTPPTNLRIEILESASEPPQRSMAMLSAWRTRMSSKGLRVVLKTIIRLLTQVPSNTARLSFILSSSWAFSEGLRPRNSASNWPPMMPGTTAFDFTKKAL